MKIKKKLIINDEFMYKKKIAKMAKKFRLDIHFIEMKNYNFEPQLIIIFFFYDFFFRCDPGGITAK